MVEVVTVSNVVDGNEGGVTSSFLIIIFNPLYSLLSSSLFTYTRL
jgi:hypothetical protein